MLEVKVNTVVIPMAKTMKDMADNSHNIYLENYTTKQLEWIEKGWESLPDLIAYVAEVVRKASVYGQYKCSINLIDDEYLWHSNKIDKRVDYKFEGMFTIEMAYEVRRVFKSAGYYVKSCDRVYYSNPQCYRTGKIELEWDE